MGIFIDTDGDVKTAELCAEVLLEDRVSVGFSLGKKKGKVMSISKWRTLNGLQDMVVERCK